MGIRKHPLVNNQVYHIFNRSIAQQPIINNVREHKLFMELIEYYRFQNTEIRYSHYSRLPKHDRELILNKLYKQNEVQVDIYSLTMMPNHYHILAKQISNNGISNFIRHIQDSYAKYLNKKTERSGGVFQSPFKAVRIENDEQLLHVARYIHLNPLTSYILKDENELIKYSFNSFTDYLTNSRRFINTKLIDSFFKTPELFKKFTLDHIDYRRKLDRIKHLIIE